MFEIHMLIMLIKLHLTITGIIIASIKCNNSEMPNDQIYLLRRDGLEFKRALLLTR